MKWIKILVLLSFLLFIFNGTAFAEETIKLNHFKAISAEKYPDHYVRTNLVAEKRTRVQIIVVKGEKILESHRLVVGSDGVVEGKHKGAKTWVYFLPGGEEGKGLIVNIFVRPLAEMENPLLLI